MNEFSNRNIELKRDFLIYFDTEGILNQLKIAGLHYKQNIQPFLMDNIYFPPFRFVMSIDLLRIQEISNELTKFLIKYPNESLQVAEELAYYSLKILCGIEFISLFDIQITFNVSTFFNNFEMSNIHSNGLLSISGVLIGRTAIYKYTRSKVLFCKLPYCSNVKGKRYKPPFKISCPVCFSYMNEDVRSSDIGEEIIGHIISLNAFRNGGRFQALKIKIRDEFCSMNLQIGMEFNLVGIFEGNYFIVWNIERKLARFEILKDLSLLQSIPIPNSVANLYYEVCNSCSNSPWSFVGAVSTFLAADILPISSFLQLKIGLMLSLATQNSEDSPVPLVAIGTDSFAVQKLMNRAGQMAERFINYSAGYEQLGGDKKYNAGEIWYEAGALVLATTGICNLGDWSAFRKDQWNYICRTVESGKIILNSTVKNKTEADLTSLKCGVWTYWCHITSNNPDQLQLKTLLNVFGMPFLADENNMSETEKICHKILKLSTHEANLPEPSIPLEELKEFLSVVNSRNLVLDESASKLIHDFFVIIRKERPECLPVRAIRNITSLAEAHARLSLKKKIGYEDVAAVLCLYNESVSAIFGSPLIESETIQFDESESIYKLIHIKFESFKINLEKYLENYLFF